MAKCRANATLQYIKRICTVCCQSASLRNRHALEPSCGACCRRVCIQKGILTEFLTRNRNEVISMSIFEYDKELEEKKLRKAEYEYGFSEGKKTGFQNAAMETARRMLKSNKLSLEDIADFSGLSIDEIKQLQNTKS